MRAYIKVAIIGNDVIVLHEMLSVDSSRPPFPNVLHFSWQRLAFFCFQRIFLFLKLSRKHEEKNQSAFLVVRLYQTRGSLNKNLLRFKRSKCQLEGKKENHH